MHKIHTIKQTLRDASFTHKLLFFTKVIIAAIVLYIIVSKIGASDIYHIFLSADPYFLLTAILLLPLNIFFQYYKWKLLCNETLNEQHKRSIFFSLMQGISVGLFTPARLGEILGRKLSLKHNSLLEVTIMTAVDKLFNLFAVGFFGAVAVLFYMSYHLNIDAMITTSLAILIVFVFAFFLLLLISEEYWRILILDFLSRFKILQKVKPKLQVLKQLNKALLIKLSLFSILQYGVYLSQFALLSAAFAERPDLFIFGWIGALMFFTKTLIPSISYGELGIREAVSIYFLTAFGYSQVIGFNASISIFFINILIPSAAGIVFLFIRDN